jgi:hypothetical protein
MHVVEANKINIRIRLYILETKLKGKENKKYKK